MQYEANRPPIGDSPGLSIVVVSYKDEKRVRQYLSNLQRFAGQISQVVVVRNSSARDAESLLQTSAAFDYIEVNNERNRGFAAAFNQGLKLCTKPVVVSSNSDVALSSTVLTEMTSQLQDDRSLLIVSPLLFNEDGIEAGRSFYSAWSVLTSRLKRRSRQSSQEPKGSIGQVDPVWTLGACLGMRRDDWELLGGFDERYFLYFEDVDLCWRAWEMGGEVRLLSCKVFHEHGRASRRFGKPLYWHITSAIKYFIAHPRAIVGLGPKLPSTRPL